jgi:hypothetical protein
MLIVEDFKTKSKVGLPGGGVGGEGEEENCIPKK